VLTRTWIDVYGVLPLAGFAFRGVARISHAESSVSGTTNGQ
jgi:hypothetical protein